MRSERLRAFLGVWMPMIVGLLLLGTAANFYLNSPLTGGLREPDLESWRLVCSGGLAFVGGVLLLSTYGRYKKAREVQREDGRYEPGGPS